MIYTQRCFCGNALESADIESDYKLGFHEAVIKKYKCSNCGREQNHIVPNIF